MADAIPLAVANARKLPQQSSHPPVTRAMQSTVHDEVEEAAMRSAQQHRATAAMLESAAAQHDRIAADRRSQLDDADRESLIEDAKAMRAQAASHVEMAEEDERRAGAPSWPQAELHGPSMAAADNDNEDKIGPILTAAALGAAVVLPGGLTLGAAAIAAAPHLGIDPDGTARRRARATLKRDAEGKFGFILREDAAGIFIASIVHRTMMQIEDERDKLEEGDRLCSIDGASVRADPESSSTDGNGSGGAAADALSAAGVVHNQSSLVSLPPAGGFPSGLSLDECKKLIRASGQSVVLEVYRLEVKPVTERLMSAKSHLEGELKKALDIAAPDLLPHIETKVLPKIESMKQGIVDAVEELTKPQEDAQERSSAAGAASSSGVQAEFRALAVDEPSCSGDGAPSASKKRFVEVD